MQRVCSWLFQPHSLVISRKPAAVEKGTGVVIEGPDIGGDTFDPSLFRDSMKPIDQGAADTLATTRRLDAEMMEIDHRIGVGHRRLRPSYKFGIDIARRRPINLGDQDKAFWLGQKGPGGRWGKCVGSP